MMPQGEATEEILRHVMEHPEHGVALTGPLQGVYCFTWGQHNWITYKWDSSGVTVLRVHTEQEPVPKRRDQPMLAGVVLAAGTRTIHGVPSVLAEFKGEPAVVAVLRQLREAGVARAVVVTGYRADLVEEAIRDCVGNWLQQDRGWLVLVRNKRFSAGLRSSLSAALPLTPQSADGVVMAFGDQPQVGAEVMRSLVSCFRSGRRIVAPVFRGQRGHPLVFGKEFAPYSVSDRKRGPAALLRRFPQLVEDLEVPSDGVLHTIGKGGKGRIQ
ncbi:MAG: nucleotidyltransferase family protein [Bacillota bacterium]